MGNLGSDRPHEDPEMSMSQDQTGALTVLEPDPQGPMVDSNVVPVTLETSEIPFQNAGPQVVLTEPDTGRAWPDFVDRVARWPILVLAGAVVLAVLFASFISRNSGNARSDDSAGFSTEELQGAATLERTESNGNETGTENDEAALGADPAVADDAPAGRSTGSAGPVQEGAFFAGQVVEPDDVLTGDSDWVIPTTVPPTTAPTSSQPTTETTAPSSTTTTQPPAPAEPWVRALGPGSADGQNPTVVTPGRLTLTAEGAGERLRYRLYLYVWDGDGWELDNRSRWQSQPSWTVSTGRYADRTFRWTVSARDRSGDRTPETNPLHIFVDAGSGDGDGDGDNDDDDDDDRDQDEQAAVQVVNGGFEQIDMGGQQIVTVSDRNVAGWSSSNGQFEVWASGFEGVSAPSGSRFLELNSTSASTMVQRVSVSPGSRVRWSLQHRSRSGGQERIRIEIGPPGRSGERYDRSASGGRWQYHEGEYRVPDGVTSIDFAIQSRTSGSVGNLIDDVRLDSVGR